MDTMIQNPANPIPVFGIEHTAKPGKRSDMLSTQKEKNDELTEQIAVCAYYKAEARGNIPGFELQDWLEAEAELSANVPRQNIN